MEGQQISQFKGHPFGVSSVSFSPDGKQLATAGITAEAGGPARLWSLEGQQITEFKGHVLGVFSVSFSPDGKQIATAGFDHTVQLWSLDGKQVSQFKGHQGAVFSVSYSPDGRQIVTAGADGTARVWSLDGTQISEIKGHQGAIYSVSYSPDGRQIAIAGAEGMVELNDLDALLLEGCNYLDIFYFPSSPQALETLHVCHTPFRLKRTAFAWVRQGEILAKAGQVEGAIALFNKALEWNPELNFDPEAKAKQFAANR